MTNAVELIRRLHEHRTWTNHKLLAVAETISGEPLRRSLPIGQGSIWKSLLHLYAAEYVWLEALLGSEIPLVPGDIAGKLPGNQEAAGAIGSLDELKTLWSKLDERYQSYLREITSADLDQVIYKISTSSGLGKRQPTRRGDVLLHVCLHAHYTAAQVVNMLRQVGVASLPDVMLISLARQQMASS